MVAGLKPDDATLMLWDPERSRPYLVAYYPFLPPPNGHAFLMATTPFPNEDDPLTPMVLQADEGPTDYWYWWNFFPSHPEWWLTPENYDP